MIIPIDYQYRIAADSHSWSIQRSRKRKSRTSSDITTEWESISWYGTLEQTANALGQLMVRTSDAHTLADALEVTERVTTKLTRALSPNFEITIKTGE